jgi:dTDP-4-dehydrorhamnose reductase
MEKFDFTNVLITGASGMLGAYIDFGIKTSRDTLDIEESASVMDFVQKHRPSAIIHLAAATDTNRSEEDPSYTYGVNSVGTLNVALAAESVGAIFVYVSTSRVFEGDKIGPYTETEQPHPKSVYGKSKYIGEVIASTVASEYIIARGCWMFGGGLERDTKFFGNVLKQLGNDTIVALEDVYGSPTYAKDFVSGIKSLLEEGKRGVFHISNAGSATRADIVEYILEYTKSNTKLERVTRSFFKNGHLLPTNESISSEKIHLRPWREALGEYIQEEWSHLLL